MCHNINMSGQICHLPNDKKNLPSRATRDNSLPPNTCLLRGLDTLRTYQLLYKIHILNLEPGNISS